MRQTFVDKGERSKMAENLPTCFMDFPLEAVEIKSPPCKMLTVDYGGV